MGLSIKLFRWFVKLDTCICWSDHMDFSKLLYVFLTLCQAKPSWKLTMISKLLLWAKGVELVKVLNVLGLLCLWQHFYAFREMAFRFRRRRKRAAAGNCAVAAQRNTSTRRSPCGDCEQCESLTQNGKRCQGQIWQPLILAGPFLEVQSLVGPALTSSSGRRLDQVSRKLLVSSNLYHQTLSYRSCYPRLGTIEAT